VQEALLEPFHPSPSSHPASRLARQRASLLRARECAVQIKKVKVDSPVQKASKRRRHPPSAIGDTSVTGALTASTEQGRAKRDARTRPPNPFVHIAKVSAGPPPQVAGPTLRDVAKGHAKRELQASVLERVRRKAIILELVDTGCRFVDFKFQLREGEASAPPSDVSWQEQVDQALSAFMRQNASLYV